MTAARLWKNPIWQMWFVLKVSNLWKYHYFLSTTWITSITSKPVTAQWSTITYWQQPTFVPVSVNQAAWCLHSVKPTHQCTNALCKITMNTKLSCSMPRNTHMMSRLHLLKLKCTHSSSLMGKCFPAFAGVKSMHNAGRGVRPAF